MKNKLIILLPLFLLIILPYKTNALTVSELRMYYFNDLGQSLSTNTTQTQNWSGYNVKYINHAFGGGSFSDIPNLLYAFMPSGLGCSGDSCAITGSFMNYVPYGVTSLNYSLDIQIEIAGVYSKCSITNSSIHDTYFEKYDFICFGSNFNQGFNLVVDNMSIYSDKSTYFGLAYETLQIKDNISYGDIINNQTQNTQVIINNQNNNWNNFNNTDISDNDKQAPNTNDYSNYQTAENDLFNKMGRADISNVNVAIDGNSSQWVWDRVTEWLNTNSLLFGFLVSMLSIGIIKMALGR